MEIRKDYILNRWVIISEGRGVRPHDFVNETEKTNNSCVFCPENESQTPKEVYKITKNGKWQVRVIPNKYSAVDPSGDPNIQTHNKYYTFGGDNGNHEIVIETPKHEKKFGDLTEKEITDIIKTYALRINELHKKQNTKYVCLFKNEGKEAGASLKHIHSQLISMSMIPPSVIEKLEAIKKYDYCPYCDIINKEKDSYRRCFENNNFIAFTPYASLYGYEVWVFPKKHIKTFNDFNDEMYSDLASILKQISQKLESIGASFDMAWYYSPQNENLHFHVEVMPRVSILAGFELGFGIEINTLSPENAASFYRGEK